MAVISFHVFVNKNISIIFSLPILKLYYTGYDGEHELYFYGDETEKNVSKLLASQKLSSTSYPQLRNKIHYLKTYLISYLV